MAAAQVLRNAVHQVAPPTAFSQAAARVAAVRDDPEGRLALLAETYDGPSGRAPRHRPFRRAAVSFMGWQAQRGLLNPLEGARPGSRWWRQTNERLLRDGCEAVTLTGGAAGGPSSPAVRLWLEFIEKPQAGTWYRAHNASIASAYLQHRELAEEEAPAERFFINVALARVLYAHALVAAPRLALGRFSALARLVGDPRAGTAGAFLSLGRVLPDEYPLTQEIETYIGAEHPLGRLLDYSVILPRVERIYRWSARELGEPALAGLIRDGSPTYAWPFEDRSAWEPASMPRVGRTLSRVTRPRP